MQLKISIIICTYNRSKYLQILLNSFFAQTLSKDLYEIIIVDNNSTDNTKSIVNNFKKDFHNARYIEESNQGISHARNRGWKEALGEYVFYIDDDCKLIEGWLEVVLNIINDIKPNVFGGPYTACYDFPKPAWVKDEYWSTYQFWGDKSCWVENQWFTGACLGIERSIFKEYGGFDSKYGMSGENIGFAEEIEWQERLRKTNPQSSFYYSPDLNIYHHVREDKINLYRQLKSRIQGGLDYYSSIEKPKDIQIIQSRSRLSSIRNLFGRLWSLFSAFIMFLLSISITFIFRDRKAYPFFQNYWFEVIVIRASKIAVAIQRIKTLVYFLNPRSRKNKNE